MMLEYRATICEVFSHQYSTHNSRFDTTTATLRRRGVLVSGRPTVINGLV